MWLFSPACCCVGLLLPWLLWRAFGACDILPLLLAAAVVALLWGVRRCVPASSYMTLPQKCSCAAPSLRRINLHDAEQCITSFLNTPPSSCHVRFMIPSFQMAYACVPCACRRTGAGQWGARPGGPTPTPHASQSCRCGLVVFCDRMTVGYDRIGLRAQLACVTAHVEWHASRSRGSWDAYVVCRASRCFRQQAQCRMVVQTLRPLIRHSCGLCRLLLCLHAGGGCAAQRGGVPCGGGAGLTAGMI